MGFDAQMSHRWILAAATRRKQGRAEKQDEAGEVNRALVMESPHPQSVCGGGGR